MLLALGRCAVLCCSKCAAMLQLTKLGRLCAPVGHIYSCTVVAAAQLPCIAQLEQHLVCLLYRRCYSQASLHPRAQLCWFSAMLGQQGITSAFTSRGCNFVRNGLSWRQSSLLLHDINASVRETRVTSKTEDLKRCWSLNIKGHCSTPIIAYRVQRLACAHVFVWEASHVACRLLPTATTKDDVKQQKRAIPVCIKRLLLSPYENCLKGKDPTNFPAKATTVQIKVVHTCPVLQACLKHAEQ
jgi:hypothetical protein